MKEQFIQDAENKFGELITNEMTRIEKMKQAEKATDFTSKEKFFVISFTITFLVGICSNRFSIESSSNKSILS